MEKQQKLTSIQMFISFFNQNLAFYLRNSCHFSWIFRFCKSHSCMDWVRLLRQIWHSFFHDMPISLKTWPFFTNSRKIRYFSTVWCCCPLKRVKLAKGFQKDNSFFQAFVSRLFCPNVISELICNCLNNENWLWNSVNQLFLFFENSKNSTVCIMQ